MVLKDNSSQQYNCGRWPHVARLMMTTQPQWLSVVTLSHHPHATGNKRTLPDLLKTNGSLSVQLLEVANIMST